MGLEFSEKNIVNFFFFTEVHNISMIVIRQGMEFFYCFLKSTKLIYIH